MKKTRSYKKRTGGETQKKKGAASRAARNLNRVMGQISKTRKSTRKK